MTAATTPRTQTTAERLETARLTMRETHRAYCDHSRRCQDVTLGRPCDDCWRLCGEADAAGRQFEWLDANAPAAGVRRWLA